MAFVSKRARHVRLLTAPSEAPPQRVCFITSWNSGNSESG